MRRKLRHILITIMLLAASQAAGQYLIDRVCVGSVRYYRIDGEPGSTYSWRITDGSGTVTALPSTADTTEVTWNVIPGIYKLSAIQHSAITHCDGVIEVGDIIVFDGPLAYAGSSKQFCDLLPYLLSESTASNYSHLEWTTSGDGTFNNDTILHPVYTPGPGDIAATTVTLTLTARGLGDSTACVPAVSSMTINEFPSVIASAGPDDTTCRAVNYMVTNATATNYASVSWRENGAGNLLNANTLNPIYVPDPLETGTVILTLTAHELAPCTDSVTDQMTLTINPTPSAVLTLIGRDTLCGGDSTTLRVDLTGTAPWTLTITDGSQSMTYSNIMTTPFIVNVVPSMTCNYMITALSDALCPGPPASLSGIIHIVVFPRPGAEFTWNYGSQNNEIVFQIDSAIINFPAVGNMILWDFGDGTYGYVTNPVHLYPAPGNYNVTLTVTDTNGCVSMVTHLITIPVTPIAFFSSTSPTCFGTPDCFTDLSNIPPSSPFGYIIKWEWDFGDGTPHVIINFPDNPNVCHTYSALGSYPATLTITSNVGYVSSITRIQTVVANPVANFTWSGACQSMAVQFTDLSLPNNTVNIYSWQWNFGDPTSGTSNTSTLQNPQHIFNTGNTTYLVTLIVKNLNNCTDTIIKPVFVRPAPPVDFIHDSACIAGAVHFDSNSGVTQIDSIGTWSWDFGDGTPALPNPITAVHTYALTGTYIATLTVTDIHGCVNSVSHEINVHALPMAAFSFSTPNCSGHAVQFTDASTMAGGYVAKWQWDFGDGTPLQTITVPGSPNISHVFAGTSSSYNVILKVWSNDSCTQETSHTVNLIPAPFADFQTTSVSCQDHTVHFTDITNTNGGGSILSWNWNFGDPTSGSSNTSSLQNPVHTFTSSGSFNVTLIVQNMSGCSDTVIKPVSVNLAPVADFNADSACLNTPTTFTNISVANATGIISYAWSFGDGTYSNQQSPTHTFLTPGTFNVILAVTNTNGCTDSITKSVIVRPLPLAAFIYSAVNCLNTPVEFTNTSSVAPASSGSIVRWVWDFGDGITISVHAPASPVIQHVFAGTATTHIVRLTVVTSDSCSNFIEHTINSVPAPVAAFTTDPQTCANMPVAFTDQSQSNNGGNISSWNWNFGDPTSGTSNQSTLQNPSHTYVLQGTYHITLIIANESGCSDTVQKDIMINPRPVVDFNADTACLTSPTHFVSQSMSPVSEWHWDFGDGATSNLPNPSHTYLYAGTFNVSLTASAGGTCSGIIIKQVIVLANPDAMFTTSAPGCAGDSVQFTDMSSPTTGYITGWTWDFGDGVTVTRTLPQSPNVKHSYLYPNTYNAKLTVITSNGCTDEKILPVSIQAAPVANFTFTPASCSNEPVQFTNTTMQSVGSPVTQWLWNFDDPGSGTQNTSTLMNPVHTFSTAGIFHVVLHATNAAGCSDSIVRTVIIGAGPLAQFSADVACQGSATHFTDNSTTPSGTITSWLWNFGDPLSGVNNVSTLQNPVHTYTGAGNFTAKLTVVNSSNCTHDTTISVSVTARPEALFQFSSACAGSAIQFTDLSTSGGSTIINWFWDFGDGTGTSTVQNPTYTYTTPGTYQVKLRVTNLNNCQDSIILPVAPMSSPVADFNYMSSYCPAGKTDFQDASVSTGVPITSRLWIFEPGYTSTLPAPTHTFSVTDTTYLVTLIVTNANGCRDTVVDSVYVKPGFAFSFINDMACFRSPTHFQVQNLTPGDSIYYVTWDFGDPSSGNNNISHLWFAEHNFTHAGTFLVKLKVMNSNGCTDSLFRYVAVNSLPVPQFSFVAHAGGLVEFTDESTAGGETIISWEWNFGDGTAPVTINAPGPGNISHPFITGVYHVTLKVINSRGCMDMIEKVVNLVSGISAEIENDDSLICAKHPVIFHDNSSPTDQIDQWRWSFGDGGDTTYYTYTPTVTHTYALSGTYYARVNILATIDGTVVTDSTSIMVIVNSTPAPAMAVVPGCANAMSAFDDISGNAGIILATRQWDFGDPGSGSANYSGIKTPVHQYDTAGVYNVKLTLINGFGCKDSIIRPTRVHALPKAAFTNTLACSGKPVQFSDKTAQGDTTLSLWHWNFGDPGTKQDTSIAQNPAWRYKDGGSYPVRMVVRDRFGCYDTVDSTVHVAISPLSAFRITENFNGMPGRISLINESTGAVLYYWEFGNGFTSEDPNPVVTYSEDGSYMIKLITFSKEDCSDTTMYQYDLIFEGLYIPNAFVPTSLNQDVRFFKPMGINLAKYKIEVFDEWGHRVWESHGLDQMGRPAEGWDGRDKDGNLYPQGTYMWKAEAQFNDGTIWQGSDIGKGAPSTMGTVTLIR